MNDIIVLSILSLATIFVFLASVGLLRLPDLYMRMHAVTKAASFGVILFLLGLILFFPTFEVVLKSIMAVLFIFFTAPVASHLIARIAHRNHIPLWKNSKRDDLVEEENGLDDK